MSLILSLSSQVVAGAVGNSASVYPLMRLGHTVWPVPTIVLSHHPGQGHPAAIAVTAIQLETIIASLEKQGLLANCDALMTGYIANADQGEVIAALVARLRAANPDLVYLCDPISGDAAEGVYVAPAVITAQRQLIALADIVTPNRFELSLYSGIDIDDDASAGRAALALQCPLVVMTSAPAPAGRIANLCISKESVWRAETIEHQAMGKVRIPKGTGDLFAGLFLAQYLSGAMPERALAQASAATADMVELSLKQGAQDLLLGPGTALIERPHSAATLTRL